MKDIANRRLNTGPPTRGRSARAAFTLLEMLTVIIIVGLLLAIGTPSVLRMQVLAQRSASLATIRVIDGGCKSYWNDFEQFPPSSPEGKVQVYDRLARQYQVHAKGKIYGPYNGCEKIKSDGQVFYDTFGYQILYYRWDNRDGTATYHNGDNSGGPSNIAMYATTDGSGKTLRRDFILCSRGPDGKWPHETIDEYDTVQQSYARRDDITNFLEEN